MSSRDLAPPSARKNNSFSMLRAYTHASFQTLMTSSALASQCTSNNSHGTIRSLHNGKFVGIHFNAIVFATCIELTDSAAVIPFRCSYFIYSAVQRTRNITL